MQLELTLHWCKSCNKGIPLSQASYTEVNYKNGRAERFDKYCSWNCYTQQRPPQRTEEERKRSEDYDKHSDLNDWYF